MNEKHLHSPAKIDNMSIEDLNARLHSICDVCGKARSVRGGHPKCAKIRQRLRQGK